MPHPDAPRVALLDVDGTLVDSNDQHAHAWVDAFREAGHEIGFDRVRPLIGMGADKIIPALTGLDADGPEATRIAERRPALFLEKHIESVRPLDGARALLAHMRERGLVLVVATSASEREFERLAAIADVGTIVHDRTTSDDAERSKPDPDIVTAALRKAKCAPHEAIMLGDTPYDIDAARRAGVGCVAVRSGGWDDAALAGALAVYEDAAELLSRWDDSPFAVGGRRHGA
jgi:HAD superfamily hydrolase (TIGR01509 family)